MTPPLRLLTAAAATLCLALDANALIPGAGGAPSYAGAADSKDRQGWSEDLADALEAIRYAYAYAYPRASLSIDELESAYAERLKAVTNGTQFFQLVEALVEELHDHHAHLNRNSNESYRLVPSSLDVWAAFVDGSYVIEDVRPGSPAEAAGLRGGMTVTAVDGVDVDAAVAQRLGDSVDGTSDLAKSWAVRTLLAGRHSQAVVLLGTQDASGEAKEFEYPRGWSPPAKGLLFQATDSRNVLYLRPENSLGQRDLVAAFDAAMDSSSGASAVVLDLTNTASGGNSDIARGIMGRFVRGLTPYQRHEFDEQPLGIPRIWIEHVAPRGEAPFDGPLYVLVNRWTGSMGEGLTLGLDTLPNSTIIGTQMAGLLGATERFDLPHSGIGIYLPTERLLHVDGYPRESFVPDRTVVPTASATTSALMEIEVSRALEERAELERWQRDVPPWIESAGHRLLTVDPGAEAQDDIAWLRSRLSKVQVLGLGESTHGTSEFFRVRHRLTLDLIERGGFNAIAFEASAATATLCDRFICGEDIAIEAAVGGLGMAIWQVEELSKLLVDLRALNGTRKSPVHFFGVDLQNPKAAAKHLGQVLGEVNEDVSPRWTEALERFAALVDGEAPRMDFKAAEAAIEELKGHWDANGPRYRAKLGEFRYLETRRQMNVLDQNLRLFADRDWTLRDAAMAENTLAIRDVIGADARIILWAHNGHLTKAPVYYTGTETLATGGMLAKALGAGYYSLGLIFNRGTFQANAYGEEGNLLFRRYRLDEAPMGALAHYFSLQGSRQTILELAPTGELAPSIEAWLQGSHGVRWPGGYNVPNDFNTRTRLASQLMSIQPAKSFDALLFLDHTSPATPMDRSLLDTALYGDR